MNEISALFKYLNYSSDDCHARELVNKKKHCHGNVEPVGPPTGLAYRLLLLIIGSLLTTYLCDNLQKRVTKQEQLITKIY